MIECGLTPRGRVDDQIVIIIYGCACPYAVRHIDGRFIHTRVLTKEETGSAQTVSFL